MTRLTGDSSTLTSTRTGANARRNARDSSFDDLRIASTRVPRLTVATGLALTSAIPRRYRRTGTRRPTAPEKSLKLIERSASLHYLLRTSLCICIWHIQDVLRLLLP